MSQLLSVGLKLCIFFLHLLLELPKFLLCVLLLLLLLYLVLLQLLLRLCDLVSHVLCEEL